jgi:ornithine cyclodeaminase/alanine dehydrogenase-like protein (mu-crystallin family)
MSDAIQALDQAFRDEAQGLAKTLERTMAVWEGHRMQALGGYINSSGCAAVKSWLVTEKGAQPTVILFSLEDGRVLALMEAVQLGRLRTGAASGLATRYLSSPDADTLLVVGSGRQAFAQVAAVAAVRSLQRIIVVARDPTRTGDFARRVEEAFSVETIVGPSVRKAASEASIISLITNAREPILNGSDLKPGTHVNAAGAIAPGAREVDDQVFGSADYVVADSVEQARLESAELNSAVQSGTLDWDSVMPLHQAVTGRLDRAADAITVFKSLGVGLEDAALAQLVWQRSQQPVAQ